MIKVRVHLKLKGEANLPVSYNHGLASAVIEKIPSLKDGLFAISGLWLQKPFIFKDDRLFLKGNASFDLSTHGTISHNEIDEALFGKDISIAMNDFQVSSVKRLHTPKFRETMLYTAISPIVVYSYGDYLDPTSKFYEDLIIDNLYKKHLKIGGERLPAEGEFLVLSEPRMRITESETSKPLVKGYLFDFQIKLPIPLQEVGFFGGFGNLQILGFGAVQETRQEN